MIGSIDLRACSLAPPLDRRAHWSHGRTTSAAPPVDGRGVLYGPRGRPVRRAVGAGGWRSAGDALAAAEAPTPRRRALRVAPRLRSLAAARRRIRVAARRPARAGPGCSA